MAKKSIYVNPFRCTNCGHSFDLHKAIGPIRGAGGCTVILLSTGEKCPCDKFSNRKKGTRNA